LGYLNGELRFWLGWAQEVAGDHTAAQGNLARGPRRTGSLSQRTARKLSILNDLALIATGLVIKPLPSR